MFSRRNLDYGPDVLVLTPDNFDTKVDSGSCATCGQQGQITVVDFYAAW